MSEMNAAPRPDDTPASDRSLLLRELPYIAAWVLTILGVAYTSISQQPLVGYWEFLALAIGAVCIVTGWRHTSDRDARLRMVWTQGLHWAAFLVAMNIVLLPGVQRVLTASATGLTLLMLLALGTFVAGLHVSWRICLLGLAMALAAPAIAWLKQSALFMVLVVVIGIGVAMTFWWFRSGGGTPKENSSLLTTRRE